jgi:3-deoxy-7-phosphoheptulonate synthase
MKLNSSQEDIDAVRQRIEDFGYKIHTIQGEERVVIAAVGVGDVIPCLEALEEMAQVDKAVRISAPYKFVSKEFRKERTRIRIRDFEVGGTEFIMMAGPCSVESEKQIMESAVAVAEAGGKVLRGGAFKPRTSPYAFQGLGERGLEYFRHAADKHHLPIVTELMDVRMLDAFLEWDVDIIQIGTRNMQNFDLLKEVGKVSKPVILKRGMAATVSEWLMAAEYIAAGGNHNIIFCERGVRSFETAYRNMLDVTAIPVLKRETHLPVIVDPSHAGGKAWLVPALSRAAIAAGADGLLVEMHPNPCAAWCDADQALTPQELNELMAVLGQIAQALGRSL